MSDVRQIEFDASGLEEFRVQTHQFNGEVDFVVNALPRTVSAAEQFQVADVVILPVAVDMVDGFLGQQVAPKVFGHDVAVFQHFSFSSGIAEKCRQRDMHISVPLNVALDVSAVESRHGNIFVMRGFARAIAVNLLSINTAAWFAAAALFFSALRASEPLAIHRVFAASEIRARHRAIEWIFAVLFEVRANVCRSVEERITTLFTSKFRQRYLRGDASVDSFVRGNARLGTEALCCIARTNFEVGSALFARFINRHVAVTPASLLAVGSLAR